MILEFSEVLNKMATRCSLCAYCNTELNKRHSREQIAPLIVYKYFDY